MLAGTVSARWELTDLPSSKRAENLILSGNVVLGDLAKAFFYGEGGK